MQGNHEEVEIFLQKCLISSRLNQKLSLKKGEHRFIEISLRKICAVRFAEGAFDGHDDVKQVGHDPRTRASLLLNFDRLIFIGVSSISHMSIRDSLSMQLNHNHRILLMRSTVAN